MKGKERLYCDREIGIREGDWEEGGLYKGGG